MTTDEEILPRNYTIMVDGKEILIYKALDDEDIPTEYLNKSAAKKYLGVTQFVLDREIERRGIILKSFKGASAYLRRDTLDGMKRDLKREFTRGRPYTPPRRD